MPSSFSSASSMDIKKQALNAPSMLANSSGRVHSFASSVRISQRGSKVAAGSNWLEFACSLKCHIKSSTIHSSPIRCGFRFGGAARGSTFIHPHLPVFLPVKSQTDECYFRINCGIILSLLARTPSTTIFITTAITTRWHYYKLALFQACIATTASWHYF